MKKNLVNSILLVVSVVWIPLSSAQVFYDNNFESVNRAERVNQGSALSWFNTNQNYLSFAYGLNRLSDIESTHPNEKYFTDHGRLMALALGKKMGDSRVELEYLTFKNDLFDHIDSVGALSQMPANSNTQIEALMVNLYQDFRLSARLLSYLGFGLGHVNLEFKDGSSLKYEKDNAFGYQFKLGLNYELSPNMKLFGGFRYLRTENFVLNSSASPVKLKALESGSIEIGLRYDF